MDDQMLTSANQNQILDEVLMSHGYPAEDREFILRAVNNFDEMREVLMFVGHWLLSDNSPRPSTLFSDDQTFKEKVLSVVEKMESGAARRDAANV